MATQTNNTNTSAQIGMRLANGEQAILIAAEFGMSETAFSRSRSQYYEAYITSLQTELNTAKTTATQLQGVNSGLQKSCEKLQTAVTELQANASTTAVTSEQMQVMETNLQLTTERLQVSETNLQTVTSQMQTAASRLQIVETERKGIAEQLQAAVDQLQEVETERDQYGATLQSLFYKKKPIAEQRILTHARFLLWAIIGFETYNAWQLLSNMELQSFPYPMAVVFSTFFGLASVTALAANHRWGVILCVTAAFFSNAIHADLFGSLSLESCFYTFLPCLLILLFADMYKKINIL